MESSPRAQDGLASKHPEILRLHTTLLLGAGDPGVRDPERAIALLRAWIGRSAPAAPGYDELCLLLAVALIENPALASDPRESRAMLEELLARDPDHPTANALLDRLEGL